ncbi:hypothetical protein MKX01_016164 [Papaver californicum]|nr:hypothetical protein MKX01_016164 [Papaver californicum]
MSFIKLTRKDLDKQVQAVVAILGGSDIPDGGQCPRCLNVSRRIASLVRFREKRKDRYYDKKFRNNAHKKVEQKMDKISTKSPIELNETFQTGGNLLMETDIGVSKDIEVPKLGLIFQSDDEAYDFYDRYARSVGFSIRKVHQHIVQIRQSREEFFVALKKVSIVNIQGELP